MPKNILRKISQLSGLNDGRTRSGQTLPKNNERGEEIFPIQVHSESVIFIAAAVIFIFRAAL
jgi:hypothetical protein